MSLVSNASEIIRQTYQLTRPYGRKKLLIVGFFSLGQGVFQVLGVTSIFPFLALAASPDRLRNSGLGSELLSKLPPMDNSQLLFAAGIFAVVMLLISNLTNILGDYVRNRYAAHYAHWLRLRLLEKIAARPYADFLQNNSGVLIKKVQGDVAQFSNQILLGLLDTLTRLLIATLLLCTLFIVHPQIAFFTTLGLLTFYGIFFFSLRNWRNKTSIELKDCGRACFKGAQQIFGGIKPVKVHRAESHFIEDYGGYSQRQARLSAWLPVIANIPRYLLEPIAFGGLVIAVLVLLSKGQDFAAILPNLGVMALAGYRLLPSAQLIYGKLNSLTTFKHVLEEVYDEFLSVEKLDDREDAGSQGRFPKGEAISWGKSVSLSKVSFRYPGAKRTVIDSLSLTIPKNTSLGIVGQTGSGKSTLVDLILGLHIPTSGKILVDDIEMTPRNRRSWRAGIGYVPQEIFLLDDTVTANIAFGIPSDQIDHEAVRRAAASSQIIEFIQDDLPQGFDTVVGERGVRLSGGQRQRIGLARALYHQPDVLVLDEATSALDIETEAEVMKAINALHGSMTLIIIAHRLATIENCDQRFSLDSEL